MTPVQKRILQRFAVLYGAPDTHDPKAFTAEYERALRHASEVQLVPRPTLSFVSTGSKAGRRWASAWPLCAGFPPNGSALQKYHRPPEPRPEGGRAGGLQGQDGGPCC